jgi:hypothetical protein
MLRRIARFRSLLALLGAATLAGCTSVQTTREYAAAQNWRPVDVRGTQYFCRREQPEVGGSPAAGVRCVTRPQLLALKSMDEYAASHGYRSVVVNSTQYYCREGQPTNPGSLPNGGDCITRADIRAKLAQVAPLDTVPWHDYSAGVIYPPHAMSEIALGLWR